MPHDIQDIIQRGLEKKQEENMDKALAVVDDRLVKLGDRVVGAIKNQNIGKNLKGVTFDGTIDFDTSELVDVGSQQLASLDKIDDNTSSAVQELQRTREAVESLNNSLDDFDIDLDTKQIMAVLGNIRDAVKEDSSEDVVEKLEILKGAISNIKVDVPDTVKLSDMQMRELRQAMGGTKVVSSGGGGGGMRNATGVSVNNVSISDSSEHSFTFPENTVSFYMKLESQNTQFHYNFETSGTLPNSGDGSAYMTTAQNFLQSRDNVEWSNKTIYFELESGASTPQTMQIEVHTL